jgi:hypothetical protein
MLPPADRLLKPLATLLLTVPLLWAATCLSGRGQAAVPQTPAAGQAGDQTGGQAPAGTGQAGTGQGGKGQAGKGQNAKQGARGKRDRKGDARTYLFDARLGDAEAVAKGSAMLERALEAAGGLVRLPAAEAGQPDVLRLPLLRILPGLRYQQLETTYAYLPAVSEDLQVHHLVPRSVHLGQGANGYLYSELVRFQEQQSDFKPEYRREVVAGAASWFEVGDRVSPAKYSRAEPGSTRARQNFERELVFGLWPHGIALLDAKVAFMEEQEVNGVKLGVYLVRLPNKVRGKPIDEVQDLLVYVDESEPRVIQSIYHDINPSLRRSVVSEPEGLVQLTLTEAVQAGVRASFVGWRLEQLGGDTPEFRAQAEAEAARLVLPQTFGFPQAWSLAEDYSSDLIRLEVAAALFDPLDPMAVARPWQTNQTYDLAPRADFWDPPARAPKGPEQGQ